MTLTSAEIECISLQKRMRYTFWSRLMLVVLSCTKNVYYTVFYLNRRPPLYILGHLVLRPTVVKTSLVLTLFSCSSESKSPVPVDKLSGRAKQLSV